MTRNMKRFNTQTRFVPLKIDEDFNVGHIQSKDGKVKDFKTRKAVEKYCKENHCIYCENTYSTNDCLPEKSRAKIFSCAA